MSAKLYTLQLEPYDDVASVRDRLTFVDASFVLVFWPPGTRILRRKLDLLLIQRQATRLGMRIALVTDDPDILTHARELNISVFPDEQAALLQRWKRPRNTVFTTQHNPMAQAELAEHVARLRGLSLTVAGRRWQQAVRWGTFVALLMATILGFLVAAPSATVTITPASKQVYETVSIVADPTLTDIDIENRQMPSALVTLEATSHVTVQSSGVESAGAALAQGLVTFANSADQPVLIPLGTIISTGGTYPVRFETMIETVLPAGTDATVQVPIQALTEHSGAAGNVDPGAITRVEGSLADVITVTNPNATYGGAAQELATVTEQDHERLLVLGRQQVLQRARDELLLQLSGEQFLVPGSVQIIRERPEWTHYSAFVGDVAESASLDLRAEVQAVVVDERQARQVAYSGLAPYIQPGLEVSPDALAFERGEILSIEPGGRVTFLMIVKGNVAVSIDQTRIRDQIAGMTISAARHRLENELLLDPDHPPQITTWPGWFNRLPFLPVRIDLTVETP